MRCLPQLLLTVTCALAAGCQTPGSPGYDKLPAVEVTGAPRYKTVRLKTRPGVQQEFTLSLPERPAAVALFFRGTVGLGSLPDIGDVLPRLGVAFALIDPPSDLPGGFTSGERSAGDHVADIDAVIRYLREQLRVPVWLAGISMGTVSVANVALHSGAGVDGAVFMAPVTGTYFGRNSYGERLVTSFALGELKVPVLAVAHRIDRCVSTPASGAGEIVRRAVKAPVREAKIFEGGYELSRDPCTGNSHHTFAGIRAEVSEHIARFILAHSGRAGAAGR